jgi:serine/threonine-protein kinase PpkA
MKQQVTSEWRCLNYGECDAADNKTPIELPLGSPFQCPSCKCEEGTLLRAKTALPVKPVLIAAAGVVLLTMVFSLFKAPPQPPAEPVPPVVAVPPPPASPVRLGGPLVDARTGLPRQVLTRPKSVLHAELPTAEAGAREEGGKNLRDFQRLFVFKEENEFLHVGEDPTLATGRGWISREDAIDWPRSLVVEYTSPDNRKPVLFFKEQSFASRLIEDNEGAARQGMVAEYYSKIETLAREGSMQEEDFPVLCVEPQDKIGDLYLLPVLDAKETEIDGYPTRVLKLTAAGRDRGATTLKDREYLKKAVAGATVASRAVPLDVVFVMDMTGTMQRWLDGVLRVMNSVARTFQEGQANKEIIRMGFWGYQDDPSLTGIQFRTKNFTPALVAPEQFGSALEGLKVNKLTQDSYPEDVFAGVMDAIEKTPWRPSSTRVLILIGDAPGHDSRQDGGETGMDAPQVRQHATDLNVKIASAFIKDSSRENYIRHHSKAETQFRILSTNDNRAPALLTIDAAGIASFEEEMRMIVSELAFQRSLNEPQTPKVKSRGTAIAEGILAAARVDQISEIKNERGEIVVPRDFTAWVVDRDLLDPGVVSLEPKLLVSKNELSTLQQTVSSLLQQGREGMIVGGNFFDRVLSTVAETTSGQDMQTLNAVVPKFISGLPYKSDLMEKTKEWWDTRTAEQQKEFIGSLEAKLAYYRKLNEDSSRWKPLNKEDESGLHVTALPLSQLP